MKFVEGINPALRVVARCDEGAYLAAGEGWISLGITPRRGKDLCRLVHTWP